MSARSNFPAQPAARTLFLCAGPRAGKTSLMERWRSEGSTPCHYVALSPEDATEGFFRYRLLRELPEIRTKYQALALEFPEISWGTLVGMAIAEIQPDWRLCLDDLHHVEDSPLLPEIVAMLRHFPPEGRLIVTSMTRLPEIERIAAVVLGPEEPFWRERPDLADLHDLPEPLQAKVLSLYVVGEAEPSPLGRELVRRNIAHPLDNDLVGLKPGWLAIAKQAFTATLPGDIWEAIEEDLRAFARRHLRTHREPELGVILNRLPVEVRRERCFLLQLEGDELLEAQAYREAGAIYQKALEAPTCPPQAQVELSLRLMSASAGLLEWDALARALADPSWQAALGPHQAALFRYLTGTFHWHMGDRAAAQTCWSQVRAIAPQGDRRIAYQHFRALRQLLGLHTEVFQFSEGQVCAERMIALARAHDFQRDLLDAYLLRLQCMTAKTAAPPPLAAFLDIPDAAYAGASVRALAAISHELSLRFAALKVGDLVLQAKLEARHPQLERREGALFHLHAFGELTFTLHGAPAPRWPRRKALSLLALLTLHPDGLPAEILAEKLFQDYDPVDRFDSLHTAAHALRQVLKVLGAPTILESTGRHYRLKGEEIAFCDLHEFDALYAKAEALEAQGLAAAATLFYEVALSLARGPLFQNLPDEFEQARAQYRQRVAHARACVQAHST